ncbi:MAG: hypothetical protein AVDCRST_MAG58-3760, partial [uncultured Rubrobacteraceae bacterium]
WYWCTGWSSPATIWSPPSRGWLPTIWSMRLTCPASARA